MCSASEEGVFRVGGAGATRAGGAINGELREALDASVDGVNADELLEG